MSEGNHEIPFQGEQRTALANRLDLTLSLKAWERYPDQVRTNVIEFLIVSLYEITYPAQQDMLEQCIASSVKEAGLRFAFGPHKQVRETIANLLAETTPLIRHEIVMALHRFVFPANR